MVVKYYQIVGIKYFDFHQEPKGGMGFFKDLLCYLHMYPEMVELKELPDYDIANPPKDKLVVEVSLNEKWSGYAIYYPTSVFLQCKYCQLDDVESMINKECEKRLNTLFYNMNSEFAQMIYNLFNIKVTKLPFFIDKFSKEVSSSQ